MQQVHLFSAEYLRPVVEAGIARGDLRPDTDIDMAVFMLDALMDRFLQAYCVPFLDAGAHIYQAPRDELERKVDEFIRLLRIGMGASLKSDASRSVESTDMKMLEPRYFKKLGLEDISRKVAEGARLTISEGERLFACPDMNALGSLAHHVRTRLHGNVAYYVVNRHINYSNICVNGCRFCAFSRKKGDPLSFELSEEEILDKIRAQGNELTEVHIVGGCHPDLPLSFFEGLLRKILRIKPNACIKAFTAVEIAHFAKNERISVKDVLARLKSAGLQMLPGGGAEVFSPRIRELLCPEKLDGNGWLESCGRPMKPE